MGRRYGRKYWNKKLGYSGSKFVCEANDVKNNRIYRYDIIAANNLAWLNLLKEDLYLMKEGKDPINDFKDIESYREKLDEHIRDVEKSIENIKSTYPNITTISNSFFRSLKKAVNEGLMCLIHQEAEHPEIIN